MVLIKHVHAHRPTRTNTCSLCPLCPEAYQLRVCQPPPEVANADMLMEDGELEIGEGVFYALMKGPDKCGDAFQSDSTC